MAKLGVNIDHVATIRNARGGDYPDPLEAALIAEKHGADGITAHLREDRRHIRDQDMVRLKETITTRLNMEMANTPEMLAHALEVKPYMVTLVPERREELTTEGGLDVEGHLKELTPSIAKMQDAGIIVSLFIDPDEAQAAASKQSGASTIELHTGQYCEVPATRQPAELEKLIQTAQWCVDEGLEVNAGHGLHYENVKPVLQLPGLVELNIGHSIVSKAIFVGFDRAVQMMKDLVQ